MPAENARVLSLVLEEVEKIEERCPRYKEEIKNTVAEIIQAELQHRIQSTRIQQTVDDKCDVAGRFLADKRKERWRQFKVKLIRARFQNFRILRDLTINFSVDPQKRLTVIRAENKTGKTTILNALQWALYGDNALPGGRNDYRLHHWDRENDERVEVSVEVDFEVTTTRYNRRTSMLVENRKEYRIIRSVFETPRGEDRWDRAQSSATLYESTEKGYEGVSDPESRIAEMLVPELKDIFFMDSDRALSFIESKATRSSKRRLVKDAIRSILGFDVISSSLRHVGSTSKTVNDEVLKMSSNRELNEVEEKLNILNSDIDELTEKVADADEQIGNIEVKIEDVRSEIMGALSKGNREDLEKEISDTRKDLNHIYGEQDAALRAHSRLFRDPSLYRDTLEQVLAKSFAKLDELRDHGKIPNETISVLEERLGDSICICGESLSLKEQDGVRRRQHIIHLIDQSRDADELSQTLTDLFFGSSALRRAETVNEGNWVNQYHLIQDRRDSLDERKNVLEIRQKSLETKLDSVSDADIAELRIAERNYENLRDQLRDEKMRCETTLGRLNHEKPELSQKRNRLIREQVHDELILARRDVTQDVYQVLSSVYERITNEELAKVSRELNRLFLRMIVVDPAEEQIFSAPKSAKILTF